jgi:signal peptidase I
MIREDFHFTQRTEPGEVAFSGDHFLVARFIKPRRWDIVAFMHPEDPTTLRVMRLVGLPGEKIQMSSCDMPTGY